MVDAEKLQRVVLEQIRKDIESTGKSIDGSDAAFVMFIYECATKAAIVTLQKYGEMKSIGESN
ncbi:MAG: hypothetical protein J6I74_08690 [Schwartzia sp.]|nr:hypothetical protein [Schwartzia sp. (in: firmicutes)]